MLLHAEISRRAGAAAAAAGPGGGLSIGGSSIGSQRNDGRPWHFGERSGGGRRGLAANRTPARSNSGRPVAGPQVVLGQKARAQQLARARFQRKAARMTAPGRMQLTRAAAPAARRRATPPGGSLPPIGGHGQQAKAPPTAESRPVSRPASPGQPASAAQDNQERPLAPTQTPSRADTLGARDKGGAHGGGAAAAVAAAVRQTLAKGVTRKSAGAKSTRSTKSAVQLRVTAGAKTGASLAIELTNGVCTEGELACELGADGGSALSAFASTSGGVSGVLRVCAAELEFHLKELRNTKPGAVRPTLCEPSRHGTAGMPTATAPAELNRWAPTRLASRLSDRRRSDAGPLLGSPF